MTEWMEISTAPRLRPVLVKDGCGELFVAKWDKDGRLSYRMHGLRSPESYRIVKAMMDGAEVEAYVPTGKPWLEFYEHSWTLWTRGFDFNPVAWSEIPTPTNDTQSKTLARAV